MKIHQFTTQSGGLLNEYAHWARDILRDYPDVRRYRLPRKRPLTWDNQHPDGLTLEAFFAWSVDKYVTLAKHYREEILRKRKDQPIGMYTNLIARMVQMRQAVQPITRYRLARSRGQKRGAKAKADKTRERNEAILVYRQNDYTYAEISAAPGIDISVERVRQICRQFRSEGKL